MVDLNPFSFLESIESRSKETRPPVEWNQWKLYFRQFTVDN